MTIRVMPCQQSKNGCRALCWREQQFTTSIEVRSLWSDILMVILCFDSALSYFMRFVLLLKFEAFVQVKSYIICTTLSVYNILISLGAAWTDMSLEREKSFDVSRIAEITPNARNFGFARVVTGDESWSYLKHSHTHIWSVSDDECPVCAHQTMASKKYMLIVLWSIKALLVIQWLGPGDKF
jgi:hypothetical protein